QSADQRISLEPLAIGLHITTRPAGADVFINGDKQSGQTPLTIPLAANAYNLVLRKQGYEPYSQSIILKENAQTRVGLDLKEKGGDVAWAQVVTNPVGAEIFVDGIPTGKQSPARVEISAGIHTITLKMNGYQMSKRPVQVTEGSTVNIEEKLRMK